MNAESIRISKENDKKDDGTERLKEYSPLAASSRASNSRYFTCSPIMEIEELEDENSPQENESAVSSKVSKSGSTERDFRLVPDDLNTH